MTCRSYQELSSRLAQARRLASGAIDPTTSARLAQLIEDLEAEIHSSFNLPDTKCEARSVNHHLGLSASPICRV
jgi:hypothetical protein